MKHHHREKMESELQQKCVKTVWTITGCKLAGNIVNVDRTNQDLFFSTYDTHVAVQPSSSTTSLRVLSEGLHCSLYNLYTSLWWVSIGETTPEVFIFTPLPRPPVSADQVRRERGKSHPKQDCEAWWNQPQGHVPAGSMSPFSTCPPSPWKTSCVVPTKAL